MKIFDFDEAVQREINAIYPEIPRVNWREWLRVSSRREHEELVLKNLEIALDDAFLERIEKTTTDPREMSVEPGKWVRDHTSQGISILCHTSGTSSGMTKNLKWYPMTKPIVEKIWAPGMQAIFESSGMSRSSNVVIMVPSRTDGDGLNQDHGGKAICLYSSEFSQRLVLSIFRPDFYIMDEYKNSRTVENLAKILSMDHVDIISAPASTILSWASPKRIASGLSKSMDRIDPKTTNAEEDYILTKIHTEGMKKASELLVEELSDRFSGATIIFSTSSLGNKQWETIRSFMGWKRDDEKFTNLYVCSETGPFAASIDKEREKFNDARKMVVFPLVLPVLKDGEDKTLLCRGERPSGSLLVSRPSATGFFVNINVGDVITVVNKKPYPVIGGDILRDSFKLKQDFKLDPSISTRVNFDTHVGDFFKMGAVEFKNPRRVIACIKDEYPSLAKPIVALKEDQGEIWWRLVFKLKNGSLVKDMQRFRNDLEECLNIPGISRDFFNKHVEIQFTEQDPIKPRVERKILLQKVRNGELAKGVLKKWPMYIILPGE